METIVSCGELLCNIIIVIICNLINISLLYAVWNLSIIHVFVGLPKLTFIQVMLYRIAFIGLVSDELVDKTDIENIEKILKQIEQKLEIKPPTRNPIYETINTTPQLNYTSFEV